jgi:hypothetical protein
MADEFDKYRVDDGPAAPPIDEFDKYRQEAPDPDAIQKLKALGDRVPPPPPLQPQLSRGDDPALMLDQRALASRKEGLLPQQGGGLQTERLGSTPDSPMPQSIPEDVIPKDLRREIMYASPTSEDAASNLRHLGYDVTDKGNFNLIVKSRVDGKYYPLQGNDRPWEKYVTDKAGDYQDIAAATGGGMAGLLTGNPLGPIIGAFVGGGGSKALRTHGGKQVGYNKDASRVNQFMAGGAENALGEVLTPAVRGGIVRPAEKGLGAILKGGSPDVVKVAMRDELKKNANAGLELWGRRLRAPERGVRDMAGATESFNAKVSAAGAQEATIDPRRQLKGIVDTGTPATLDLKDAAANKAVADAARGGERLGTDRPMAKNLAAEGLKEVEAQRAIFDLKAPRQPLEVVEKQAQASESKAGLDVMTQRLASQKEQDAARANAKTTVEQIFEKLKAEAPKTRETYTVHPTPIAGDAAPGAPQVQGLKASFQTTEGVPPWWHWRSSTIDEFPEIGEIMNKASGETLHSPLQSGSQANIKEKIFLWRDRVSPEEFTSKIQDGQKALGIFARDNPEVDAAVQRLKLSGAVNNMARGRGTADDFNKLMDALDAVASTRKTTDPLANAEMAYQVAQIERQKNTVALDSMDANNAPQESLETLAKDEAALRQREMRKKADSFRANSTTEDQAAIAAQEYKDAAAPKKMADAEIARDAAPIASDLKDKQIDVSEQNIQARKANLAETNRPMGYGTITGGLHGYGAAMERTALKRRGLPDGDVIQAFLKPPPRIRDVLKELRAAEMSGNRKWYQRAYDRALAGGLIRGTEGKYSDLRK